MNKKLALIILLQTIVFIAYTQSYKKGYAIQGKIEGVDSAKVYLSEFVGNGKSDSAVIKNGTFRFTGNVTEPTPFILSLERNFVNKPLFLFFMGNEPVTIILNKNDLRNSQLKGSVSNLDYGYYQKTIKPFDDQFQLLAARRGVVSKDSTAKSVLDSVENARKMVMQRKKDAVKVFVKTHSSSAVSAWAVTRLFLFDPDDMALLEELYKGFTPSLCTTSFAKQIKEKLDKIKSLAVGLPAPDFTQNDTTGTPVSLKDFKGRYVLLDFWASWCGPCRAENPNVVAAYNKYRDKNFTILSVSLDMPGAKNAWLAAIHKDGLTWTHVSDLKFWDNEVGKLYGVNSVPANFLIDPSGKIIAKDLHEDKLQGTLEQLLSK